MTKLAEIKDCRKCPHAFYIGDNGGICQLISEDLPYFTDADNQILDNCPLPDAEELIELRKIKSELKALNKN